METVMSLTYKTVDGQIFFDEEEAKRHEDILCIKDEMVYKIYKLLVKNPGDEINNEYMEISRLLISKREAVVNILTMFDQYWSTRTR